MIGSISATASDLAMRKKNAPPPRSRSSSTMPPTTKITRLVPSDSWPMMTPLITRKQPEEGACRQEQENGAADHENQQTASFRLLRVHDAPFRICASGCNEWPRRRS